MALLFGKKVSVRILHWFLGTIGAEMAGNLEERLAGNHLAEGYHYRSVSRSFVRS